MVLAARMRLVPVAYLASYLLSLLGNAIAGIALPLIVLQSTGSALGAGTVAAATAVPAVAAGLFMGVVIDRVNRRTASVLTDLISAASVAALPVVDAVTGLGIGWFVLFGIIGSLGDVPGLTAREAMLPAIVRAGAVSADRLVGIREALGAVALLLGPAAAGVLMVLFAGSTVLWITAGTSAAAALVTLLIPRQVGRIATDESVPSAPSSASAWAQLRDGWQALLRNRFLMTVTAIGLVSVFTLGALQGLILPVYFTLIGQPGAFGFVLTALALGMLLGAGVNAAVGEKVSRRVRLLSGLAGITLGFGMIATLSAPWLVFVGAFVIGASSGLFNSLLGVLMIERIPDELRGRIMGTQNAIMTAAPPAGIFGAALIVEFVAVRTAAIAVAACWLLAVVVTVPARSLRSLGPDAAPGPDTAVAAPPARGQEEATAHA